MTGSEEFIGIYATVNAYRYIILYISIAKVLTCWYLKIMLHNKYPITWSFPNQQKTLRVGLAYSHDPSRSCAGIKRCSAVPWPGWTPCPSFWIRGSNIWVSSFKPWHRSALRGWESPIIRTHPLVPFLKIGTTIPVLQPKGTAPDLQQHWRGLLTTWPQPYPLPSALYLHPDFCSNFSYIDGLQNIRDVWRCFLNGKQFCFWYGLLTVLQSSVTLEVLLKRYSFPHHWCPHPRVSAMTGSCSLLTTELLTASLIEDLNIQSFTLSTWRYKFSSVKLLPDNLERSPGFIKLISKWESVNTRVISRQNNENNIYKYDELQISITVSSSTSFPLQINTSGRKRPLGLVVFTITMRAHRLFPAIQRRHVRKPHAPQWSHVHILRHTLEENDQNFENNERIFCIFPEDYCQVYGKFYSQLYSHSIYKIFTSANIPKCTKYYSWDFFSIINKY